MLALPQCSCRALVIKPHMISGWKAIPFYSLLSSLPHKHLNITILTADENLAQESIFKLPAGVAMPALPPPCHEPLLAFHHSVGLFCCLCTSSVLCCASDVHIFCRGKCGLLGEHPRQGRGELHSPSVFKGSPNGFIGDFEALCQWPLSYCSFVKIFCL